MKNSIIILLLIFLMPFGINVSAQKTKITKGKIALKTPTDSLSYCIGVAIMKNLSDQGADSLNLDAFLKGMKDVVAKTPVITPEIANQYVNDYFQKQYTQKAEKGKGIQTKFLEENRTKEGVKVTASGLQYKIITQGTGTVPKELNTVKVHYKGSLIDGTTFDSSYDRGEPIEFAVTGVIKGWVEALLMMPQGSKWELYIPSELGYGDKGAGGTIPPFATLVFLVELLEVK